MKEQRTLSEEKEETAAAAPKGEKSHLKRTEPRIMKIINTRGEGTAATTLRSTKFSSPVFFHRGLATNCNTLSQESLSLCLHDDDGVRPLDGSAHHVIVKMM